MTEFHKELENCTNEKTLILGNGFGLSYDKAFGGNHFSWHTLLELCEIKKDSPLYELLKNCNLDFERVHQKLKNAIDILSNYSPDNELIPQLEGEIQVLRNQLITAVRKSHPKSFNKVDFNTEKGKEKKQKIEACRNFLKQFSFVFSLNYDLLLYWLRCFDGKYLGQDSFNTENDKLVFSPDKDANYLFPHGALFLFRYGFSAMKLKNTGDQNSILNQVKDNIGNGNFPMCISEGTGDQKLDAIKSNSYLLFAYEKLKECQGTIFTFGCSFQDKKDSHIIEAILRSPSTKVVVGVHTLDEVNCPRLQHEFAKSAKELNIQKNIVIADTSTVNIWQP